MRYLDLDAETLVECPVDLTCAVCGGTGKERCRVCPAIHDIECWRCKACPLCLGAHMVSPSVREAWRKSTRPPKGAA